MLINMPIEQYDSVINNIQKICNKILDMKSQFERLELSMHVNINYLAKLFAMRMFDQLKAMFALSNNENHILISEVCLKEMSILVVVIKILI